MHLASISSQEENDKLEKHIRDFGKLKYHIHTKYYGSLNDVDNWQFMFFVPFYLQVLVTNISGHPALI